MKLAKIFLGILLFQVLFLSQLFASSFTGIWEVQQDSLDLVRLEVQNLPQGQVLLRLLLRKPGEKLHIYTGQGSPSGNLVNATLKELGSSSELSASFSLQEKGISGTWKGERANGSYTFTKKGKNLPLGATEVFTGDRPSDLENLPEQLKIFKAVEMAMTVDFQNKELAANKTIDMGPLKIKNGTKISVSVKTKKNPTSSKDLMVEKLVLQSSESIRVADKFHIRSVAINDKGHISFNIDSFPDLTITQLEKKSNGDYQIHIKNFPDLTIKKNGKVKLFGFITLGTIEDLHLPEWPVDLGKLWEFFQNSNSLKDKIKKNPLPELLQNVGSIDYKIKAVGDPNESTTIKGIPIKTNALSIDLDGSLAYKDGKLLTSKNGKAKIHIELKDPTLPLGTSSASAKEATLDLDGLYSLEIPINKEGGKVSLLFDGKTAYSIAGGKVDMLLPGDTALFLDGINANGSANVSLSDISKGLEGLSIKDGKLHLTSDGTTVLKPLGSNGFYWGGMPLNNNIILDTRYNLDKGTLSTESNIYAVGELDTRGAVGALDFKPIKDTHIKTGLRSGKVEISMEKLTTSMKLGDELKNARVSGSGQVSLDTKITGGEGSYKNLKALIEGEGDVAASGSFGFSNDASGFRMDKSEGELSTHLSLKPGTKLSIRGKNGKWNTVTIQGLQSQIHFSLQVANRNGTPYIKEAKNIDAVIEVGNIEAKLLGLNITGRGKKTIVLQKGTVKFLPNGVDFYGNLSVRLESVGTEPLVSIRWD